MPKAKTLEEQIALNSPNIDVEQMKRTGQLLEEMRKAGLLRRQRRTASPLDRRGATLVKGRTRSKRKALAKRR